MDEVGSMSVAYTIVVNQALRSLNMLKTGITDVIKKTQEWSESDDKQESKLKNISKAWAVVGTVATAALYSIMKASSYAAIYSKQFGAQIQRVANIIMEETGLNKAMEGTLEVFDKFIDRVDDGNLSLEDLIATLSDITDWWNELSKTSKVIIAIMAVVTVVGLFLGGLVLLGLVVSGVAAGLGVIVSALALVGVTISAGLLLLALLAGALLGGIAVWILWKTGILDAIYDLGGEFGTFLLNLKEDWKGTLLDMIIGFGEWVTDIIGEKNVGRLVKGFKVIKTVWNGIKTTITAAFDIIKEKVKDIIDLINNLIDSYNKIPILPDVSNLSGGSRGTSINPDSMMGGGDYSDHGFQFGGPIKETGLHMLHEGEFVVPKAGKLISSGGGGNTYNISTNVNVAPGTSGNMASEISRQVSKAIADEVKRITKI